MLVATTPALVQRIDHDWPQQRPVDDYSVDWAWSDLLAECRESFAIVTESGGDPVAIFGAKHSEPLKLLDGPLYRIDFLEVAPARRGSDAGVLLLALVALRAGEVGARGIVGASFNIPGLLNFYQRAGAKLECPRGWNPPAGVIPLHFDESARSNLEAIAHAQRDDQGTA